MNLNFKYRSYFIKKKHYSIFFTIKQSLLRQICSLSSLALKTEYRQKEKQKIEEREKS